MKISSPGLCKGLLYLKYGHPPHILELVVWKCSIKDDQKILKSHTNRLLVEQSCGYFNFVYFILFSCWSLAGSVSLFTQRTHEEDARETHVCL